MSFGVLYASPNIFVPDPAIQIAGESGNIVVDKEVLDRALSALKEADIEYFGEEINKGNGLIRLRDRDKQLRAQSVISRSLKDDYVIALNLAATTPQWLTSLGAGPMKLGLDLSGGVHFLLEVDTSTAIKNRMGGYVSDIKGLLRAAKVRGIISLQDDNTIRGKFRTEELRERAIAEIRKEFPSINRQLTAEDGAFWLTLSLSDSMTKEIEDYAVNQNLTTLRNRVNELGVAEPLVQKQGRNRIVVELPGVQDTATAKVILGKTANLEFRLEAKFDATLSTKESFSFKDKTDPRSTAFLEKRVVITGDQVGDARASFDENGRAQVNITLDGQGGKLMHRNTRNNVGRNLGVLFIERKYNTVGYEKDEKGREIPIKEPYDQKRIISLATIQSALGTQFRITGLDNTRESSELALLLRAGALAAPIQFVEERTVGPSLGQENIDLGVLSVQIGMALVLIFMLVYYKVFGIAANIALIANLVLLVAMMSILSATLTLPGIAGIVLTVGMAVDANVLIFARIREELKNGSPPQTAIKSGYDRAFVTIMDANVTTLIVAVILYGVGTGPVRGFAVTLSLGIITSMFTAIMGTRALVNLYYGGRKIQKLNI